MVTRLMEGSIIPLPNSFASGKGKPLDFQPGAATVSPVKHFVRNLSIAPQDT